MSYTFARQPRYFDLAGMLDLGAELEMAGVDFVTLHDRKPRELRAMAEDRGLPVICHTFQAAGLGSSDAPARETAANDVKRGLEAAVDLGAPVVMIVPVPHEGVPRDVDRRNWIEGLKTVAVLAEDAGVALTVENFPGARSAFVTAADFLEAHAAVPSLKLTYDNGNAASGEPPAESFTQCAELVVHAHFKDWTIHDAECERGMKMLDGRYYRPALIGEGDIDHASCLRAMREAGYSGCIDIEYEGNEYPPAEAVRRAVAWLRKLEREG